MRMIKTKCCRSALAPRPLSKKIRYKIMKTMEINNEKRQAVENTGERSGFKASMEKRREMSSKVREGLPWGSSG